MSLNWAQPPRYGSQLPHKSCDHFKIIGYPIIRVMTRLWFCQPAVLAFRLPSRVRSASTTFDPGFTYTLWTLQQIISPVRTSWGFVFNNQRQIHSESVFRLSWEQLVTHYVQLQQYLAIMGKDPGPLFHFCNESALTRQMFVNSESVCRAYRT